MFTEACHKARIFFDDDKLQECIDECQRILEEPGCPRYHRIQIPILLGSCVEDISDVGECYREAERLLGIAHAFHSEMDVATTEALEYLQRSLDTLREAIVEKRPNRLKSRQRRTQSLRPSPI